MSPIVIFHRLIFVLIIAFTITGCSDSVQEDVPDVSHIPKSNVNIKRIDQLLLQLDTNNLEVDLEKFESNHPNFFKIYFQNVLGFMDAEDRLDFNSFKDFVSFEGTQHILDTIQQVYPDLQEIEEGLAQAYQFAQYYLPEFKVPNHYALSSNFNFQRFIFEDEDQDGVGIGLDFYLAPGFDYKAIDPQNPTFSDYLSRAFTKDHIVKNTVELLLEDYLDSPSGVRLIDLMIHNGKKIYLMDKILPFTHDTIIMEYSNSQLDWAQVNEEEMWRFFLDEKLIYETNEALTNKYVRPGPHSPGMPDVSPGRTANYLGWKIVQSYMRKNPSTSIQELLAYKDSQKFLERSRFRPKNRS